MKKYMRRNGSLIALLMVLKSISLPAESAQTIINSEDRLMLGAKKIKEACFNLKQNEQIKYSFKASDPVKFNIHYHIGSEVFYPVANQLTPEFKTTIFTAPSTQHYCFMWSNPHDTSVTLNFRIRTTE
jgi:hypothetical protein